MLLTSTAVRGLHGQGRHWEKFGVRSSLRGALGSHTQVSYSSDMDFAAPIDDVVGASPSTAARVIDITEHLLRDWARRSLLEPTERPQVGRSSYMIYSIEDLVQGRVVKHLRERGVSMQQIRRIVHAVRSRQHPRPLVSLRWAVAGGEAFAQLDDEWYGGKHPDQGVIPEVIDLEEIRISVRRELSRPRSLAGQITRKRGVQGYRPVFAGTRVPVETVQRYVMAGVAEGEILESFPTLYPDDVAAARARTAV